MRLALKIGVVFTFFSLILFGFAKNQISSVPEPSALEAVALPQQASLIGELPNNVPESSGIEIGDKPGTFYTHNDAGNAPELFKIDAKGKLLQTITVGNAENIDWEDLTRDSKGNIYIGDIGNNSNKRKIFKIYKFKPQSPDESELITFEYGDRKAGTADKEHYEFDSEALFWHNSKLYFITKDREHGVRARLYEVSDQAGEHEAKFVSYYDVNAPITSADISPDGKTLLLLSEGKIHLFKLTNNSDFFKSKIQTYSLGKVGQTEAAVFTDNKTIVFTSEEGKLYRYHL